MLKEIQKGTLSNQNGKFHLRAKPGKYTVYVQFLGYKPFEKQVTLTANKDLFINIKLEDTND